MAASQELADVWVTVLPSFQGGQKAIAEEFGAAGAPAGKKAGKGFVSGLGGAIGGVAKVTAGAVGLVGAAIGGMAIKGGIDRVLNIEDAQAKLKGLGHDAQSVEGIMTNALASVKGTAFGLGDASTVAAGVVAAGVKPGQDLERTLKLVGDAATIAGTDMGSMGSIFNKVASSDMIQGDVLAQLGDAGIPILQLLGTEMGKSAEEVRKLASDGKINFEIFQNAMEKGLGGAALSSGDTFRGALANTKAALGRVGATFITPFLANIGTGLNAAIPLLDGLNDSLKPIMARFGEWSSAKFPLVLAEITGGLTAFSSAWKANDGDVTSSGFPGFMERAAFFTHQLSDGFKQLDFSSVSSFFASIGPAAGQAGGAFSSIGASLTALGPAFVAFGEQIPKVTAAAAKLAGVGLNILVGALSFLADNVETIIAFMPLIVAGFVAWRIATSAMGASMFSLQAAQVAMAPVNLANNIIRVQAIRLEMQHAAATGANTAAQTTGMFATIRNTAALVAQRVATGAGVVAMGIATAAQWAWNAALTANPISLIIIGIAALVAGLIWFFTQTELGRAIFSTAFEFIRSVALGLAAWFTGTFIPAISAVWGAIGSGLATVGQFFADTWNTVIGGVMGFSLKLGQFFLDMPGLILRSLGDLGGLLLDAGGQIMTGFLDGLKAGWTAVTDFVGGIGNWIAENKGPKAYDLALLVPAGGWIMDGLGKGIEKSMPALGSTLGDVSWMIQNGIDPQMGSGVPLSVGATAPTASAEALASSGSGGGVTIQNDIKAHDTAGVTQEVWGKLRFALKGQGVEIGALP